VEPSYIRGDAPSPELRFCMKRVNLILCAVSSIVVGLWEIFDTTVPPAIDVPFWRDTICQLCDQSLTPVSSCYKLGGPNYVKTEARVE